MAQTYLNKKQELFAKFMAQGCTQAEAYELAGYEPSAANASTLANKDIVKRRIEELRADHERKELEFRVLAKQAEEAGPEMAAQIRAGAEWNFQRIMDMMGDNVRLAQVAGEYKAANECLKMMGEAMKMFADAKAKNEGQPQGNLALIGQLVQTLGNGNHPGLSEPQDDEPDNPLMPKSKPAK